MAVKAEIVVDHGTEDKPGYLSGSIW